MIEVALFYLMPAAFYRVLQQCMFINDKFSNYYYLFL
jgi:hypothetical protein